MSSKRWLMLWAVMTGIILVLMMLFVYSFDPFHYYRMNNEDRLLGFSFATAGLIKNYNYDAVIIGSSMAQNYDMPYFRESMGIFPLKLAGGGLSTHTSIQLYDKVRERGKATTYIINIDLPQFASSQDAAQGSRTAICLADDTIWSNFQYLLGYETWFRYIPVDLFIQTALRTGVTLPEKFYRRIKVDYIEDWSLDAFFSKQVVIDNYTKSKYETTKLKTDNLLITMTENIDEYTDYMMQTFQRKNQYIYIFPPYSALYWYTTQRDHTFDSLMDAKAYFIEKFEDAENVRIVDMQSLDTIIDLDNYKGSTHFSPKIQMIAAEAIAFGGCDTSVSQIDANRKALVELVAQFEHENRDWLR